MRIDGTHVRDFIARHNYDLRITHNSRFTDQKCIPDVVCAVAECTLEYVGEALDVEFTKNDIWHSGFSARLLDECFTKPGTGKEEASKEYDKFFGQPLKMLAASGILAASRKGNVNCYKIEERDLLEWISLREKNAETFLYLYLTKVMEDTGMMTHFNTFFDKQDKKSLNALRDALDDMYAWLIHSEDGKEDETFKQPRRTLEAPRIYNKIINILAFHRKKRGQERGHLTKGIITLDKIRYNQINWRDMKKPKDMTRQEYAAFIEETTNKDMGFYNRSIEQAKRFVRDLEQYSEVHHYPSYRATDTHHIFMKSEYPNLADIPENIIALTGTEHYSYAHPHRNTQRTDADYQMVCLLSKLDSIERNFQAGHADYSLSAFSRVLNEGLETDEFSEQMGFEMIKARLLKHLRPARP